MKKTILFLFACIATFSIKAQVNSSSLSEWEKNYQKEIEERQKSEVKSNEKAPEDAGLVVERGNGVNQDGYALIGTPNNHIAISSFDIQRKLGSGELYSTLWLNYYGGNVDIASGSDGNSYNTTIGANFTNEGLLSAYNTLWVGGENKNVGIGTSVPNAKLHLAIPDNTDTFLQCDEGGNTVAKINGNGSAEFSTGVTTDFTGALTGGYTLTSGGNNVAGFTSFLGGLFINNYTTGATSDILIGTQNLTRMIINEVGNVGIGDTAPEKDLHLTRTGSAEVLIEADTDNNGEGDHAKLLLSQDNGITTGEVGYYNSTNDLRVINHSGGAAIVIKSNGDIIIGKQ